MKQPEDPIHFGVLNLDSLYNTMKGRQSSGETDLNLDWFLVSVSDLVLVSDPALAFLAFCELLQSYLCTSDKVFNILEVS